MALLDKLKRLVGRHDVPPETQSLFEKAGSADEVLYKLDTHLTRNQVEFKKLEKQISRLEDLEQSEISKIKNGEVTGRQKDNALMTIRRLRQQLDSCLARQRIFDKNMILHINLINRIRDVQAMQLSGVDEDEIDSIIYEFDENWDRYTTTLSAGRVVEQPSVLNRNNVTRDNELRALEAEILGGAEEVEELEEAQPNEEEPAEEAAAEAEEPVEEAPERPPLSDVLDDDYFDELESVRTVEDLEKLEEEDLAQDRELEELERELFGESEAEEEAEEQAAPAEEKQPETEERRLELE